MPAGAPIGGITISADRHADSDAPPATPEDGAADLNDEPGIADGDDFGATIKDISGQGARDLTGLMASIKALFGARIAGAKNSGLGKDKVRAMVSSLTCEMQAALRAGAKRASAETAGRIASAIAQRGKQRSPMKDGKRLRGQLPQQRGSDHRAHEGHARQRHGCRAAAARSFKDAARAALVPAPSAPRARRRRSSGGGMAGFRLTAQRLVFRPAVLPVEAYGPAVAFLSDTLHWLELWQDPATGTAAADTENGMQNLLSPHL